MTICFRWAARLARTLDEPAAPVNDRETFVNPALSDQASAGETVSGTTVSAGSGLPVRDPPADALRVVSEEAMSRRLSNIGVVADRPNEIG